MAAKGSEHTIEHGNVSVDCGRLVPNAWRGWKAPSVTPPSSNELTSPIDMKRDEARDDVNNSLPMVSEHAAGQGIVDDELAKASNVYTECAVSLESFDQFIDSFVSKVDAIASGPM